MAIVNGYDAYVINPNILSEYNVDQSGEVVSAEVWKALWDLVLGALIKYDRAFIDIYRTLTDLNTELDNCIQRVDRIEEIYDALAERMETLEKTWTELQATYNKIAGHYEDIKDIHDALKEGLVHYGVDAPTLKYTKLWVVPTQFPLSPLHDVVNAIITSRTDSELDENSENPVQNKAIVNYLTEILGAIGEELERLDDEIDLKVPTFKVTGYADLEAKKDDHEAVPSIPTMLNHVAACIEALRTEIMGDLDDVSALVGGA